jgi:hypothetical protein
MPGRDGRSPAQIREQIRSERAQLDAALAGLAGDAKRSGRRAASVLAGVAGLMLVRRVLRRR